MWAWQPGSEAAGGTGHGPARPPPVWAVVILLLTEFWLISAAVCVFHMLGCLFGTKCLITAVPSLQGLILFDPEMVNVFLFCFVWREPRLSS